MCTELHKQATRSQPCLRQKKPIPAVQELHSFYTYFTSALCVRELNNKETLRKSKQFSSLN